MWNVDVMYNPISKKNIRYFFVPGETRQKNKIIKIKTLHSLLRTKSPLLSSQIMFVDLIYQCQFGDCYFFLKKFDGHMSISGAIDTPVSDFWWRLLCGVQS